MWGTNGVYSRFGGSTGQFGSNGALGSSGAFGSYGQLGSSASPASNAPSGGYPGGSYSGYSGQVPAYYQGFANPGLAYANSLGYSRFGVNDTYSGSYASGNGNPGGYSPYYGNNGGVGLNSSGINSMGLNSAGLNSGLNGNYATYYYGNSQNYRQGMQAGSVQSGPGVGNLGYPNPITAGSYPGNNAGVNFFPANAGPSGNYAPTYYGNPYVTPNYNYGTGGPYATSGPGVGNFGYPNPVTPGAYPTESAPWF